MNNKPFIYLAGNLTHYKKQGTEIYEEKVSKWRNEVVDWLIDNNIPYFNPADTFEQEQAHSYSGESVVAQNEHFLNKTDILIVDLNELDKSAGTWYEVVTAHNLGIPVVAIGECELYKYSPHLCKCVTERFKDVQSLIEYITTMFI